MCDVPTEYNGQTQYVAPSWQRKRNLSRNVNGREEKGTQGRDRGWGGRGKGDQQAMPHQMGHLPN